MYDVKRFDFTPILGWSVSRYDVFQLCKRQYFYTYYGKYDTIIPEWKINTLKKMTSIPLEIGNIAHDIIEVLLTRLQKTDDPIDTHRFADYVRRKTEDYCNAKIFSEIYYTEINRIDADDIFKTVKMCLDNLLGSERFEWLKKEALLNKDHWIIEPGGYGETRIDEMKAYCKVDFLFPVNKNVFILDWKTGKPLPNKHVKQLKGYSSWASFHFSKNPTEIIPIIAYLKPAYSETEVIFNEFDLEEFSIQVRNETQEMHAFCDNVEKNIPKNKAEFKKTENKVYCRYCNFRELCE